MDTIRPSGDIIVPICDIFTWSWDTDREVSEVGERSASEHGPKDGEFRDILASGVCGGALWVRVVGDR
jgi:hypothetical protein